MATMQELKRLVSLMEIERENLEMTEHAFGEWEVDTANARAVAKCNRCGVLAEVNAQAEPGAQVWAGEAYSLACDPEDVGNQLPAPVELADIWPTFNPAYDFVFARFSRFTEPRQTYWIGDKRIKEEAFMWLSGAGYLERVGPWYRTVSQYKIVKYDVLTA